MSLTPQQKKLLTLVARGLSNKAIAKELNVTSNTIESYISNLYQHFKVTGKKRLQLLEVAERQGFLEVGTVTGVCTILPELSSTENHVVTHLNRGLSAEEIAHKMFLKKKTVENHISSILRKLSVDNQLQIILVSMGKYVERTRIID